MGRASHRRQNGGPPTERKDLRGRSVSAALSGGRRVSPAAVFARRARSGGDGIVFDFAKIGKVDFGLSRWGEWRSEEGDLHCDRLEIGV